MDRKITIKLRQNRYQLIRQIPSASASYGEIWQGESSSGEAVAIKFVCKEAMESAAEEDQQAWLDHLEDEILFLSRLNHEESSHIVRLVDHGVVDGLPVLVLELMHCNLKEWVKLSKNTNMPPKLRQIIEWCLQITLALSAVHQKGEHHRDLKLSNLLVDADGKVLKLADFGAVKLNDTLGEHSYAGTPIFMAPEQALPHQRVQQSNGGFSYHYDTDHRTDFFALGLVLFSLITDSGRLVSQHEIQELRQTKGEQAAWEQRDDLGGICDGDLKLLRAKLQVMLCADEEATLLPRSSEDPITQPLLSLIVHLLARDKDARPQNTAEIIEVFETLLELLPTEADAAHEPTLQGEAKHTSNPFLAPIFAIFVFTVFCSGIAWWISDSSEEQPSIQVATDNANYELPLDDEIPLQQKTTQALSKIEPVETLAATEAKNDETALEAKSLDKLTHHTLLPHITKRVIKEASIPTNTKSISGLDMTDQKERGFTKPITEFAKKESTTPISGTFRDTLFKHRKGPEMVMVPGGKITMGRNDGPFDERPAHPVIISAFAVSRYEITIAQFKLFCKDKKHTCPSSHLGDALPITEVSHDDALAFTEWMTKQTAREYRLPTEAEWEYLAKIENQSTNKITEEGLIKVLNTSANNLGIFGLHGNVWELVSDCAHPTYTDAPANGQHWGHEGNGDCSRAIARGGSWFDKVEYRNSTNRLFIPSTSGLHHVGFRIVTSLPLQ